jgi:hypothetical protein
VDGSRKLKRSNYISLLKTFITNTPERCCVKKGWVEESLEDEIHLLGTTKET